MCAVGNYDRETPANLQQNGALGAQNEICQITTVSERRRGFEQGWNDRAVIFSTCRLWAITVISALGSNPTT